MAVRQPWASAIFQLGKDVENRRRRTSHRGRIWVYAASRDPFAPRSFAGEDLPGEPLPHGVILGCVELVDCVTDSNSRWALPGEVHWLLRQPMLLADPVPARPRPGMWWQAPPRGELGPARSRPS